MILSESGGKMNKLAKIIKIIVICLLLAILAVNISIMVQSETNPDKVPKVFNYKPFIVLSGSMESQIHVGDLILVKEVNVTTLKEQDIIAYRDADDIVTTHRIIEITKDDEGNLAFITKGDANNKDDGIIKASQVEGLYQKRFGGLGNAIMFIQKPLGFAVVVLTIFIVCMFVYIWQNRSISRDIRFANEEEKKAFEEFKKTRDNK